MSLRDTASQIRDTVQEVYEDLRKHIGIIRYIPKADRENLIKILLGLYDICKITSASSGRHSDCVSILSLSDSDTRPKSRASDREIEDAAKMVRDSNLMTRSDRMDVICEAMSWGERGVSGNLQKVLFLRAVGKGRDREFFGDVWLKLLYADDPRQFTGRCGRVICTQEYIDHIERRIFGRDIPDYYGGRSGDRAYGRLMTSSLENIAKAIGGDLEQGIRDNGYMQDKNAQKLKEALKDLERCGVRCYSLERKVDQLAWFVGGDPEKIRKLQQKLNELGVGDRLKEDGVYGRKTDSARASFLDELMRGTLPTLTWVDPFQSNVTGVRAASKIARDGRSFSRLVDSQSGRPLFRADLHAYNKNPSYYHINVDTLPNASSRQISLARKLDHAEMSKEAYDLLKDFRSSGKVVRVAGRVLLVAGAALDAVELCNTIDGDLHDADRKIGKKTYAAAASIGGSWAGGALGAKGGALAGATIGSAILPGIGTAVGGIADGLIVGVAGSFAGSSLGKWVIDITEIGE